MSLAEALSEDAVAVDVTAADWREAIERAGELLTRTGVTTDEYTREMIAAVEKLGPYMVLAPGIALAHSRPSPAVLQPGISWVQLAEPVEFGHAKNDPVWLVVGLAAKDHDGHIALMSSLAAVLADPDLLDTLRAARSTAAVLDILSSH